MLVLVRGDAGAAEEGRTSQSSKWISAHEKKRSKGQEGSLLGAWRLLLANRKQLEPTEAPIGGDLSPSLLLRRESITAAEKGSRWLVAAAVGDAGVVVGGSCHCRRVQKSRSPPPSEDSSKTAELPWW
ncbi:hypothetical protein MLD38_002932 [Melastoma candidum]|uniref:Uncharacterized protein n=1 Tax=Melastoma candidum TaxID=119954 RepID=A0ACB9S1J8_9MYRT|nr:hypothetical protein MLD38_002932 [Melastoma candidum]